MICRRHVDGWLFISQLAHARMAGELAAAWGNAQFAAPRPRDAVILATQLHDIGWLKWDARPRLGDDNRPANFLDTTLEETIPIWRQAVEWVRIINPFAGLLVSLHATTIYRRRLERNVDPPEKRVLVQNLIEEQEGVQAGLRLDLVGHPEYGNATKLQRLAVIYRWLRVSDLLSLAVLAGALPQEGQIQQVPIGNGDEFSAITYRCHPPFALEISPWPFAGSEIQIPVHARYLNQETFLDQDVYHSALAQAPWRSISITLQSSN